MYHQDQQQLWWWARDWPLISGGLQESRRTERWVYSLQKNGWLHNPEECFTTSDLTDARKATRDVSNELSAARRTKPQTGEQAIRTDALIALLTLTARSGRTETDTKEKALETLDQMLCTHCRVAFEINLGVAACPVVEAQVDLRVFTALPRNRRYDKTTKRFMREALAQEYLSLRAVLEIAMESNPDPAMWKSIASVIDVVVLTQWQNLPWDPLAARVRPAQGKKKVARLDAALKEALIDASMAGPKAFELVRRAAQISTAKRPPSATRMEEGKICQYIKETRAHFAEQEKPPRVAFALDGSRRGGFKVLLGCCTDTVTKKTFWPVPQNMRDFRGALLHNDVLDEETQFDILFGLALLNQALHGKHDQASETRSKKRQRTAAYDLGLTFEHMLRNMGLSLQNFMSIT